MIVVFEKRSSIVCGRLGQIDLRTLQALVKVLIPISVHLRVLYCLMLMMKLSMNLDSSF